MRNGWSPFGILVTILVILAILWLLGIQFHVS